MACFAVPLRRWSVSIVVCVAACTVPRQTQVQDAHLVPSVPPDSTPSWLYSDTTRIPGSLVSRYAFNIHFKAGTTQLQKQAVVDSLRGKVVGGDPALNLYLVQIPTDATGALLFAALKKARGMSQVDFAGVFAPGEVGPYGRGPSENAAIVTAVACDSVPAVPPDTNPAWLADDSSWEGAEHDGYLKRVVSITFKSNATLTQKQEAICAVHGAVVGGGRVGDTWGYYLVQVPDDGTGRQLAQAIELLKSFQDVVEAGIVERAAPPEKIRIRGTRARDRDVHLVPETPGGGVPAWVFDDSAQIPGSGRVSKNTIWVAFKAGTSQKAKQAAIDSIQGIVIGGRTGTAEYLVKIPTNGTRAQLRAAIQKISSLPGVLAAHIYETGGLVP